MSCLRHLGLDLKYSDTKTDQPPPTSAGGAVPLSKLTHPIFSGHKSYLQALVVGLAVPSLQYLNVELCGQSHSFFPIPRLCKFICDTECQFTHCGSPGSLGIRGSRFARALDSQSVDGQPFRILIPKTVSLEQMGQKLSGPLSTVEGLVILRGMENRGTQKSSFKRINAVDFGTMSRG
ncbi:hypothetical protein BJY52DRAFT_1237874 [Lactarius psammicola]|nr:hypothetical protein BJY52DRAFT_1237874 [Lactarius psammicola]